MLKNLIYKIFSQDTYDEYFKTIEVFGWERTSLIPWE
ncbi:hypothetical protein ES706_05410 [subsurface metagenome]